MPICPTTKKECEQHPLHCNTTCWLTQPHHELISPTSNKEMLKQVPFLDSMPFIKWYSGATEEMIMRAYKRYLREEINNKPASHTPKEDRVKEVIEKYRQSKEAKEIICSVVEFDSKSYVQLASEIELMKLFLTDLQQLQSTL